MRALFPLLAIVGVIALPATLAQEQTTRETAATSVQRQLIEPRQSAIVRLTHAEAHRISKALAEVFAMEPTPACGHFKIIPDDETNSLVMTGSADAITKARTMLKELDQPPIATRQAETIRLKHARAKDLAYILQQVSSIGNPSRAEMRPGITVDERTASVILTGDPVSFVALKALIEMLDICDVAGAPIESNSTQARITVYEVDVPRDRAAQMSSVELSKQAGDEHSLQTSLTKFGTTRHMFTLDQSVDLASKPSLQIGSHIPIPSASATQQDGSSVTTVQYHDLGCTVELGGTNAGSSGQRQEAHIHIEIATMNDSDITVAANTKAPIMHKIKQTFSGTYEADQPFVLVSLESSPARESSTAYVTRIEFSKPAARG